MSDLAFDGPNCWRETFHDGKRLMLATMRLVSQRVVEIKVA